MAGQALGKRADERQLGVEHLGRVGATVAAGPEVAQLAHRVGVEGAGHHARVAQGGHALDHLVRGLVGERHEQDPARRDDAGRDRIRRAAADDARLARARAGEDHQRAARGLGGRALSLVQVRQNSFWLGPCLHCRGSSAMPVTPARHEVCVGFDPANLGAAWNNSPIAEVHPMDPTSGAGIFSIGHSNVSVSAFFELLRTHRIEVLVDVRSSPSSRYSPHFGGEQLRRAVDPSVARYMFMGRELGGRPTDDNFYDRDGFVRYDLLARSPLFLEGMERLVRGGADYQSHCCAARKTRSPAIDAG